MNHFPPSPKVSHKDCFEFFAEICGDIPKSRCTTGINDTGGKFATGVNYTGGTFAAGVVDTGGNLPPASLPPASLTLAANLPPVSLTPVANLLPVSTAQGKLVAKFAAGVIDTGGKFVASAVSLIPEEILPMATPVTTLPPLLLITVVHRDLRICPRIIEKIQIAPGGGR